MIPDSATLVELLCWRASRQPTRRLYTFISDGEPDGVSLTLAELDRRARAIASRIQDAGGAGKPVLLLYPPGLAYIEAFFGSLYAGAIAVPSYLPRSNPTLGRLKAIVEDSQSTIALTTSKASSGAESVLAEARLASIEWLTTDDLPAGLGERWRQPETDPHAPALIQYTSGSTTTPKGVVISHSNLLHNQRTIKQKFEQTSESIIVSWLPLYHDMGLIGNVIQPLYVGAQCILMPPAVFLRRPYKWLQAITRFRATTSGGPNFAYDLCVRRVSPEMRKTLDLSSWNVAFNGAEPVRADTLERFAEAFAGSGFRREAFRPCYGLAEATLMVSASRKSSLAIKSFQAKALEYNQAVEAAEQDKEVRRLVNCGKGLPDQRIAIVHPERLTECSEGQIGEIWVSSPSVAQGYWKRPKETGQIFGARIIDVGEGPFLRTGDLGFLKDGELIVTGRLKDLIIIRGQNFYPQDIEFTAEQSHSALRPGCGAAFSIEIAGEERVALAYEIKKQSGLELDEVMETIRQALIREHELRVYAIVLIKPQGVPKTSSGKVQRNLCKERFLAGRLDVITNKVFDDSGLTQSEHPITHKALLDLGPERRRHLLIDYLCRHLASALKIDVADLDPSQSTAGLGIDSLMAAEINNLIEADLNLTLNLEDWLRGRSIAQIADELLEQLSEAPHKDRPPTSLINEPSEGRGEFLAQLVSKAGSGDLSHQLSSEQERLWFLDKLRPGNPINNITAVVRISGNLSLFALEQAINKLIQRQQSLRTAFDVVKGQPVQVIIHPPALTFPVVELRGLSGAEGETLIEEMSVDQSLISFDLAEGMLFRATLWRLGNEDYVALFTFHHITSDFESIQIFFEELGVIYDSFSRGEALSISELPIQYVDFASWQRQCLQENLLEKQISYWRTHLSGVRSMLELPVDSRGPETRSFRGAARSFVLPFDTSEMLRDYARREGVTVFMVMLAGFKVLLYLLTKQDDILVGTPTNGRILPELKNLIGFFAYPLVMRTKLHGNPTFQELVIRVRDTALAAYAHQNAPFAKVVEATRPERQGGHSPLIQVIFGFLRASSSAQDLAHIRLGLTDVVQPATDFDLSLTMVERDQNIHGRLISGAGLFSPETTGRLVNSYCEILQKCVQQPELRLSEIGLDEELEKRVQTKCKERSQRQIVIAATFTAEPIEQPLRIWTERLSLPSKIEFAPYNQVFQQLLDPSSLLSKNKNGINILLIRFEDWRRYVGTIAGGLLFDQETRTTIERQVRDLTRAIRFAADGSTTPYLVCVCQASPAIQAEADNSTFLEKMEDLLESALAEINGVYLVRSTESRAIYQVSDYYDSTGDRIGHIPYTPLFFAALGTTVARKISAMHRPQPKVIVLDCDGTLWKGVCGEDGAWGIDIDRARKAFQESIVVQREKGRLICLCSKNNEADVFEVFTLRTEMPIRLDHLTAWRINWLPKSQNLKSLAAELKLGLESFIFIDDNPIECAEVEANCPEVLTLRLPEDPESIADFLDHIWALDQLKTIEEDKNRASLYQQNVLRERLRQGAPSLEKFLAELDLRVQASKMSAHQVPRVAQLTQRTNQFNFTGMRRSENEVQRLCSSESLESLVFEAKDRFGDYGLVGAILFLVESGIINVDTFLLSCRSLGRGVEHKMLAELGAIALERGADQVRVKFFPTGRNQPALDFLESVGGGFKQSLPNGYLFSFPAEFAAEIVYDPRDTKSAVLNSAPVEISGSNSTVSTDGQPARIRLTRIATTPDTPRQILDELRVLRRNNVAEIKAPVVTPRTSTEKRLASIFSELLSVEQVSLDDDFLELGGHSLLAIRLISNVREAFGVEVPLSTVLADGFTIENLAVAIETLQIEHADSGAVTEMLNELDRLTDEEIEALLAGESNQS
jgi:FkbH-like protein